MKKIGGRVRKEELGEKIVDCIFVNSGCKSRVTYRANVEHMKKHHSEYVVVGIKCPIKNCEPRWVCVGITCYKAHLRTHNIKHFTSTVDLKLVPLDPFLGKHTQKCKANGVEVAKRKEKEAFKARSIKKAEKEARRKTVKEANVVAGSTKKKNGKKILKEVVKENKTKTVEQEEGFVNKASSDNTQSKNSVTSKAVETEEDEPVFLYEVEECFPPIFNVHMREKEMQKAGKEAEDAIEQLNAAEEATGGVCADEYLRFVNSESAPSERIEIIDISSEEESATDESEIEVVFSPKKRKGTLHASENGSVKASKRRRIIK